MRIISAGKDYYDCIQKYGMDNSIVWVRKPEKILCDIPHSLVFNSRYCNQKIVPKIRIIGFCGNVHLVIKVGEVSCYTYESTCDAICNILSRKDREIWLSNPLWSSISYPRKKIEKIFKEWEENVYSGLFLKYKTPVWMFNPNSRKQDSFLIKDFDKLQNFNFAMIEDPYSAFQKLQSYVGSVLLMTADRGRPKYKGEPMDSTVSDKDMVIAKGFDKFSFRKEKEKNYG